MLVKGKKKPTLGPVTMKRRLVIARMIFPNAGKPLKAPAQRLIRAAKEAAAACLVSGSIIGLLPHCLVQMAADNLDSRSEVEANR